MFTRTLISLALCLTAVNSVALDFDPNQYTEEHSGGGADTPSHSVKSAPAAFNRDDLDSKISKQYWRQQKKLQRDPESFFRKAHGIAGSKKVWRYTGHYIPIVKDTASGEIAHVTDPVTGKDMGVAYKRIWAYTLIEVSEDSKPETHRGRADLPFEGDKPIARFVVQPLPPVTDSAETPVEEIPEVDDNIAAWRHGISLRQSGNVPAPADLPRFQEQSWGHVAAVSELGMTSNRGSRGPGIPEVNVLVAAENSQNPVGEMVERLVGQLPVVNPQVTTPFTALVLDSASAEKFHGAGAACGFTDEELDDFEEGPVFILRGKITNDKISITLMGGRSIGDDAMWENLVTACGEAFQAVNHMLGLRAVGFGGKTPDEDIDLKLLENIYMQRMKASMWMTGDGPIGVKVFVWNEHAALWKSSSFVLNNGHDDTLHAFAHSLIQAAATTNYINVQLVRTAAALHQITLQLMQASAHLQHTGIASGPPEPPSPTSEDNSMRYGTHTSIRMAAPLPISMQPITQRLI